MTPHHTPRGARTRVRQRPTNSSRDALAKALRLLLIDYRFRFGSAPDASTWVAAMREAGCPEPLGDNAERFIWENARTALDAWRDAKPCAQPTAKKVRKVKP